MKRQLEEKVLMPRNSCRMPPSKMLTICPTRQASFIQISFYMYIYIYIFKKIYNIYKNYI